MVQKCKMSILNFRQINTKIHSSNNQHFVMSQECRCLCSDNSSNQVFVRPPMCLFFVPFQKYGRPTKASVLAMHVFAASLMFSELNIPCVISPLSVAYTILVDTELNKTSGRLF